MDLIWHSFESFHDVHDTNFNNNLEVRESCLFQKPFQLHCGSLPTTWTIKLHQGICVENGPSHFGKGSFKWRFDGHDLVKEDQLPSIWQCRPTILEDFNALLIIPIMQYPLHMPSNPNTCKGWVESIMLNFMGQKLATMQCGWFCVHVNHWLCMEITPPMVGYWTPIMSIV